jgi:nucleoside-diphosphate-sugar epimerase
MTGATGFFGKSLIRHLPDLQDYEIVRLSRSAGPNLLVGDVRDFKFPEGEFDYIFHGAATSSKLISDAETTSVIMEGTKHVLKFAKTQPAKFFFVSSGAVYGPKTEPSNEDSQCDPITAYGKTKLLAEHMVKETITNYCIARCFAFVGEDLPLGAHFAIGNFINDCLDGKPILISGDGTPLRTYLYTKDLAQWLWKLMLWGFGTYNVGAKKMVSIQELANIVRKAAGTKNAIWVLKAPPVEGLPECYAPDTTKATEYGLEETVSLEQAIKNTIEYHRG